MITKQFHQQILSLPYHDKVMIMNILMQDITKQDNWEKDVPLQHREILNQRMNLVAEGKVGYTNWEDVLQEYEKI